MLHLIPQKLSSSSSAIDASVQPEVSSSRTHDPYAEDYRREDEKPPVIVCSGDVLHNANEDGTEGDTSKMPVKSGRVCRIDVLCGQELLDVCVDSGATISLLSREAYERIRSTNCTTPLSPSNRKLSGASGKKLQMDGVDF